VGAPGLSLKGRALRWLAQREHSRAELARKLARHAEDAPEASAAVQVERVLDALAAAGLLSDRRAAEALVAAQSRRFGNLRLRHALRQRGVGADDAAAALAAVQGDELARAQEVWQRRFGVPAQDAAGRAKQARFLAGRGFGADVVRRVVRGLPDDG
jgi:regulatory protein